MRIHALLVLTAGVAIAADAPSDEAVKKEQEKLRGTWSVHLAEFSGAKAPDEQVKKVKVTFAADKMIIKEDKRDVPATYTLDLGKTPPTIDVTAVEGNEKGKVMLGIYQLDGDELKLCLSRPGKEQRPTEFATKEGSEQLLMVLKRDRP